MLDLLADVRDVHRRIAASSERSAAKLKERGAVPELECFDLGIVRSVGLYRDVGMLKRTPQYNFVMGVASGMSADVDLLPLLLRYIVPGSPWQATCIGRAEIWPVHRRAAELGGHLRSGLEDTFYLPGGERATDNAQTVEALARIAREVGREVASSTEARQLLAITSLAITSA